CRQNRGRRRREPWSIYRTAYFSINASSCRLAAIRRAQFWRRRRDSNPRYAFGAYNGLANRRLQPLGHVSASVKRALIKHRKRTKQKIGTGLAPRLTPQTLIRGRKPRAIQKMARPKISRANGGMTVSDQASLAFFKSAKRSLSKEVTNASL